MGRIPMGTTLTWRKTTAVLTSTRKTPQVKISMGGTHKKKTPSYHDINTEDSMGRIPMGERSHEEKHGSTDINTEDSMGTNLYGRNACTRRKSLTLMTLTQKTLWAEFLWAKRLYKKKNFWLSWHEHRRLHGQNSYGRTLTKRKSLITLTQILRQHRRHYGQNCYGRNACTRKKKPLFSWHQHRRLHGQNSYGRTLTWRKTTALLTSTWGALWDIQLSLVGHRWKDWRNSCGQNLRGTSTEPYGTSNGELLRAWLLWAWLLWVILRKTCGQKSHGRPKPCRHSMGHLSTRSYGHLTCLDIFSVGQLLIFTFTFSPVAHLFQALDLVAVKSKMLQFQFALAFL